MDTIQSKNSIDPKTLDNQVRVSSPENISFQYEISGPMRRLMAYLADVVATIAGFSFIVFVFSLLLGLCSLALGGVFAPFAFFLSDLATMLIAIFAFMSLWFYGAYMETYYNGQTLGKMCFSIRTISSNGSSIDSSQATLRNFFRLLDIFPLVSPGLIFGPDFWSTSTIPTFAFGLIAMIVSRKFQRIGDLVAGTIVVIEDKKWVHGLAQFQDPRVAELAELLPESFVTPAGMAKVLAQYVDRRRVLSSQRVAEIAAHLAKPMMQQFELPANTNADLFLCSLYYKTFMNRQEELDTGGSFKDMVDATLAAGADTSRSPV